MKKAQSISINTIIIAAIALAVLVVLFMVFTGRMSLTVLGIGQATNCEQQCKAANFQRSSTPVDSDPSGNYGQCSGGGQKLPGAFETENGIKKACCCS